MTHICVASVLLSGLHSLQQKRQEFANQKRNKQRLSTNSVLIVANWLTEVESFDQIRSVGKNFDQNKISLPLLRHY